MTATPATVVVLHGAGDDPDRLAVLVGPRLSPGRPIVTPVGSFAVDGGPAWLPGPDDPAPSDGSLVAGALDAAQDAIDAVVPPSAPVVLVGFSQGAAVALALALRRGGRRPQAVVALAGFLLPPGDVDYDPPTVGPDGGVALHLVHGADDEVVDPTMGRSAHRWLVRQGLAATWTEVPAGHEPGPLVEAATAHRW